MPTAETSLESEDLEEDSPVITVSPFDYNHTENISKDSHPSGSDTRIPFHTHYPIRPLSPDHITGKLDEDDDIMSDIADTSVEAIDSLISEDGKSVSSPVSSVSEEVWSFPESGKQYSVVDHHLARNTVRDYGRLTHASSVLQHNPCDMKISLLNEEADEWDMLSEDIYLGPTPEEHSGVGSPHRQSVHSDDMESLYDF
jgi:hypothetical protein